MAIGDGRFAEWRASNDVVYATTGQTRVSVVVPPTATASDCRG
jgi:hypothetical protein